MKFIQTLGVAGAAALVAGFALASDAKTAAEPTVKGQVTGKVTFEGDLPKIKPLSISAEAAKGCCPEGESVNDEDLTLLIDKETKGIANVVVALEVDGFEVKLPEEPVHVDQQGCRFHPHVSVVHEGTTVAYKNSDAVSHNIHTYSVKNGGINVTVAAGKDTKQTLKSAEAVKVACDIHPWMGAYVYVTKGTHWAVTGRDGSFTIDGVPPGEYKLEIWHEKLGKGKGTAVVKDDGSCDLVEIKMSAKKKGRGRGRGR